MNVEQFSSLAENSELIQVDQKSGFFSVTNLHGTSLDPVEATKEVFTKLKGKCFDPYKASNNHQCKVKLAHYIFTLVVLLLYYDLHNLNKLSGSPSTLN